MDYCWRKLKLCQGCLEHNTEQKFENFWVHEIDLWHLQIVGVVGSHSNKWRTGNVYFIIRKVLVVSYARFFTCCAFWEERSIFCGELNHLSIDLPSMRRCFLRK
jgi:hypothetical protein